MEFIFKFIFSVVMVGVCAFGLRWIWTSHLDVRATVDRAVTKFSETVTLPPEWVVTRKPDKIYQQGKNAGDEWHLLSSLGMATSLDFRASRLACSRQ
jgi:hypothetical protein